VFIQDARVKEETVLTHLIREYSEHTETDRKFFFQVFAGEVENSVDQQGCNKEEHYCTVMFRGKNSWRPSVAGL